MSNKLAKYPGPTTVIAAVSPTAGSPGQAARKAYTSYEYMQVCAMEAQGTGGSWSWVQADDGDWGYGYLPPPPLSPYDVAVAQVSYSYVCRFDWVPTYHPATVYIAPTPATPGTPEKTIYDFNLGWNAGARSVAFVNGDGYAKWRVPYPLVGAVLGINDADIGTSYSDIEHAIYFSKQVARIYEGGAETQYLGSYASGDLFEIRRLGTTVTYYKNSVLVYTSGNPSTGTFFLDSSLYAGGDYVYDPVIAPFNGTAANGIAADGTVAYGSQNVPAFWAAGGAPGTMLPLEGLGGNGTQQATSLAAMYGLDGNGGVFSGSGSKTGTPPPEGLTAVELAGLAGAGLMLPLEGTGAAGYATYGSSVGALQPITGEGGFILAPPAYALGNGDIDLIIGAGYGMSGEIGQSAGSLIELQGIGSDRPYAESRGVLPQISGYSSAYEGATNATIGNVALVASPLDTQTILAVVMLADGTIVTTLALGVRVEAEIGVSASVTFNHAVQMVLNAALRELVLVNADVPAFLQDHLVYVVNMDTKATSVYEDFPFNSYMQFDGAYFGAKSDGVFRLEGSDDDGDPIRASVNFGKQNFGTPMLKRMSAAYIGVSSTGTMYLRITTQDKKQFTYAARRSDGHLRQQRVDVGRGIEASYLTFELLNKNGADFELDTVTFQATQLTRRI